MQQIRAAVLGATGGRGRAQTSVLAADERAKITVLASRKADNATLIENAAKVEAEIVADWREAAVSENVDAVFVCLPNVLHFDAARAALEVGKHVYVEYPMVQTPEEMDELEDLAGKKGLVLCGGLNVWAEPDYLAVKESLPKIGDPVTAHRRYFGDARRTTWYVNPKLCGDMYLALHIHFIWQFHGLLGKVLWVNADTYQPKDEGYCYGSIHMGHETGTTSLIEFGMGLAGPPALLAAFFVQGTEGCINVEGKEVRLTKRGAGSELIPIGSSQRDQLDTGGFLDQILGTGEPLASLTDNREAMELCLACRRSAAEGRRVAV